MLHTNRRSRRVGFAFVTVSLLVTVGVAAPAAAQTCGEVLTASVTLMADVVCTGAATGLRIAADAVRVDLNGHAIQGDGTGVIGIEVLSGVDAAQVVGPGRVEGFQVGVRAVFGSTAHRIAGIHVEASAHGVWMVNVTGATVLGTVLQGGGSANTGIFVAGSASSGNVLYGNIVSGFANGIGISLGGSNRIEGNLLSNNLQGIHLIGSSDNRVINNVGTGNSNGIRVAGDSPTGTPANRNLLRQNDLFDNSGAGILLANELTGITNRVNRVEANIARTGMLGVQVQSGHLRARVTDNVLLHQTVEALDDGGVSTVVSGNLCVPGGC
jgi:parallel beta-helix repeat protein